MHINEAFSFLESRAKFGMKLGLKNMQALLAFLGHPEKTFKSIHIAGTNGKGSSSTTLATLLNQQGFRVGLYTSPFVYDFFERIRCFEAYETQYLISDAKCGNISSEDFASCMEKICDFCVLEEKKAPHERLEITYFEVLTALSFLYFQKKACDYVVVEVGLGGRFDATNVLEQPLCTVITALSYDHMHILGESMEKIALEKAGILKEKVPLVFYDPHLRFSLFPKSEERKHPDEKEDFERAKQQVQKIAKEKNAPVYLLEEKQLHFEKNFLHLFETRFHFTPLASHQAFLCRHLPERKEEIQQGLWLKTRLLGKHQAYNAALALQTFFVLLEKETHLQEKFFQSLKENKDKFQGLSQYFQNIFSMVAWHCRMEVLLQKPLFLYDGSHNEDGCKVLARNLEELFSEESLDFLCGMLADKEVELSLKSVFSFHRVKQEKSIALKEQAFSYAKQILSDNIGTIYLLSPESERAMSKHTLKEKVQKILWENLQERTGIHFLDAQEKERLEKSIEEKIVLLENQEALEKILLQRSEREKTLIGFGSLYLGHTVKQAVENMKKQRKES